MKQSGLNSKLNKSYNFMRSACFNLFTSCLFQYIKLQEEHLKHSNDTKMSYSEEPLLVKYDLKTKKSTSPDSAKPNHVDHRFFT